MSDESKAAIAVSLWCVAFNGGILLAAEHKAVGFMIAISATLIFLVYLAGTSDWKPKRNGESATSRTAPAANRRSANGGSDSSRACGALRGADYTYRDKRGYGRYGY